MKSPQVLVIEGSRTDDKETKKFTDILDACNVSYLVDCASVDWHAGKEYSDYIQQLPEETKLIAFIGGMSLAAPGIISAELRNLSIHDVSVFGVPTDKAAQSAIEDRPVGNPLLTSGLNRTSSSHSIQNSALAVSRLALAIYKDPKIEEGLEKWFKEMREGKKKIEKNIKL